MLKPGDRVQYSEEGKRTFRFSCFWMARTGLIIGVRETPHPTYNKPRQSMLNAIPIAHRAVCVLRDGNKIARWYNERFWEKV